MQVISGKPSPSQRIPVDLKKVIHVHGQKIQTGRQKRTLHPSSKVTTAQRFPGALPQTTCLHLSISLPFLPPLLRKELKLVLYLAFST